MPALENTLPVEMLKFISIHLAFNTVKDCIPIIMEEYNLSEQDARKFLNQIQYINIEDLWDTMDRRQIRQAEQAGTPNILSMI